MSSLSIAVATVLFFSFQGVVLSQSGELPQLKINDLIPEFAKPLAKPNDQDDPIKKLQREQLIEILACVQIRLESMATGSGLDIDCTDFYNASAAAFNLSETSEKKVECLEYLIKSAKLFEQVADRQSAISGSRSLRSAKFWRLDAEINLLKFKKDPAIFQFPFRFSE